MLNAGRQSQRSEAWQLNPQRPLTIRGSRLSAANQRQRWLVLATLFVVMLFLIGSTAMTVPIFFMPLAKHYGWSHARTSLLPTVFVLLLGGAAPIAGWLLDRMPARIVMGTGAAMIATDCCGPARPIPSADAGGVDADGCRRRGLDRGAVRAGGRQLVCRQSGTGDRRDVVGLRNRRDGAAAAD